MDPRNLETELSHLENQIAETTERLKALRKARRKLADVLEHLRSLEAA